MRNFILAIGLLAITGCCQKYINHLQYSGTVKIPADHENRTGIIALPIDDENRKAIIYKFKENDTLEIGDPVNFRIAKVKDLLVARNVYFSNNVPDRDLPHSNYIELHNGVEHPTHTAHTIRHIINGRWKEVGVTGNDGKIYNIGDFEDPSGIEPDVTYALTADISLETLIPNGVNANLQFNENGSVVINNETYIVVDAVALNHVDLPH